jgi:hypothetical protein
LIREATRTQMPFSSTRNSSHSYKYGLICLKYVPETVNDHPKKRTKLTPETATKKISINTRLFWKLRLKSLFSCVKMSIFNKTHP